MRRYVFYCTLLPVMLASCRQTAEEPDWHIYGLMPHDSLKRELASGRLTSVNEMLAHGTLGMQYFMMGQYDSARISLRRSLAMPGGREYMGGRFIANLANTYAFEGNYTEAMKYYMEALEVGERLVATGEDVDRGEENIVRVAANLYEILFAIGNHEHALYYALRGEETGRRVLEKDFRAVAYMFPQLLYVIGSVRLEQGKPDKAQEALVQTFEIADSVARLSIREGDPSAGGLWRYSAYGLEGQARVALAKGDPVAALELATEAMRYAERLGDPTVTAKILAVLSDIHLARGDHAASGEYAGLVIETHPEHSKLNPDVLFNAAVAHLHAGESAQAHEYFDSYAARVEENTGNRFRETMAGMEVVYETEKREARISTLEKQRRLYTMAGVAGGLFLLTLCVVFLQRIRHERQQKRLAAANAVIEWEKRERKRFAGDLHDGINGMLSAIKLQLAATCDPQSISNRLDECIDTIRRMARGMMPSSLERYGLRATLEDYCRLFPGVRFHFYGEEGRLVEKLELTLYYCAHELVGNSFRHAGASNINVQLIQGDSRILLTVNDDGCGFDAATVSGGSGLQNLRDRVASVGGKIDIDSRSGRGTETNIEINTDAI